MAKQLSDILEAAEQVRNEQTPAANTAERVGGVLTDLAQYVGQSLMVSDVQVEADATGLYLKLYFNDDNGEPYERKLKLPNAEPNAENPKSGVLSPALFDELKAAGGFKDLGEFDNWDEAYDYCATPEVAGDQKCFIFRVKIGEMYSYYLQSWSDNFCVQDEFSGTNRYYRVIEFQDDTFKKVTETGDWMPSYPVRLHYDEEGRYLILFNESGEPVGDTPQLPLASASVAGLMDPAQFTKLQGLAPVFKNNPTATASQNGLMSAADKAKLDALVAKVAALEAAASAAAE